MGDSSTTPRQGEGGGLNTGPTQAMLSTAEAVIIVVVLLLIMIGVIVLIIKCFEYHSKGQLLVTDKRTKRKRRSGKRRRRRNRKKGRSSRRQRRSGSSTTSSSDSDSTDEEAQYSVAAAPNTGGTGHQQVISVPANGNLLLNGNEYKITSANAIAVSAGLVNPAYAPATMSVSAPNLNSHNVYGQLPSATNALSTYPSAREVLLAPQALPQQPEMLRTLIVKSPDLGVLPAAPVVEPQPIVAMETPQQPKTTKFQVLSDGGEPASSAVSAMPRPLPFVIVRGGGAGSVKKAPKRLQTPRMTMQRPPGPRVNMDPKVLFLPKHQQSVIMNRRSSGTVVVRRPPGPVVRGAQIVRTIRAPPVGSIPIMRQW